MDLLDANDRAGAYPPSLYAASRRHLPDLPPLAGEARADVAVIGAGYTGLSAALHLALAGFSVVVLEAQRVGFGASGRNGGQVGSGQRLDVDTLERMAGRDTARALWDMAEEAKSLTRDLAARSGVAYHPGIAHAARSKAELRDSAEMAEKLARDYDYHHITPLDRAEFAQLVPSPAYIGGDLDEGAGHLDPLDLALGVAGLALDAGAVIHERSRVRRIEHAARPGGLSTLHTDQGLVRCDHVILAANGYLGKLEPKIAARVMPINNYIVATEPLGDLAASVLTRPIGCHDAKFVVNYWRLDPDCRLIFGGGESLGYRFPKDIAGMVRRPLLQIYPQLKDVRLTHAWGGTLAITMSRMPCFARPAPNCLSASGYSGHGVAMAHLAGKIMAEAVAGQAGRFDVFAKLSPRRFPGGAALRHPLLVLGMTWFALRDRLGI
ncbi:MAG: FAD-binding oxidoreductase [Paracoccus sp. (in: a-proteobacteria)]|nr:FAD-binding oxidoreductase [Paracoccus sp. (in: a-proteobacteria)]